MLFILSFFFFLCNSHFLKLLIVLVKDEAFHLPSKTKIAEDESIKNAAVDVTEVEIERPKKTKRILFRKEKTAYNEASDCC